MRYVTSVSKMYKHRGLHKHRESTKKYWHIIGYDYDDYEEEWKMFCEKVSWIKAVYHKGHKFKRVLLTCPECKTAYYHFLKHNNDKDIGNAECPDCDLDFKYLAENFVEELGL